MNILVTGAKGMVGTALCNNLRNLRDGRDRTRSEIAIDEVFEYDRSSTRADLKEYCEKADFVFHLAGINRTNNSDEAMSENYEFTNLLIEELKEAGNLSTVMFSSSIQASLSGRFSDSEYGRSKLAAERLFFKYGEETGAQIAVYRFPNVMGHSRPNYNSAISTFCWAIANDEPYTVHDPNTQLDVLYIDDLVDGMMDLLLGKEMRCDYSGLTPIPNIEGKYCFIPETYYVSLGEVVELLEGFKKDINALCMPKIPSGSFAKKLCSLFLTYLPTQDFKRACKMNIDERGSFTELMHTPESGQVSVNITKPGITKGEHWHNSKWEVFIVVAGHGLIQQRNINTGQLVEFAVSGESIEAVYIIPGWTHKIVNTSSADDLVTVMICNEAFDPRHPDTFYEEV